MFVHVWVGGGVGVVVGGKLLSFRQVYFEKHDFIADNDKIDDNITQ